MIRNWGRWIVSSSFCLERSWGVQSVDTWAYGYTLYEMATGHLARRLRGAKQDVRFQSPELLSKPSFNHDRETPESSRNGWIIFKRASMPLAGDKSSSIPCRRSLYSSDDLSDSSRIFRLRHRLKITAETIYQKTSLVKRLAPHQILHSN